jgi:hypothetical protein
LPGLGESTLLDQDGLQGARFLQDPSVHRCDQSVSGDELHLERQDSDREGAELHQLGGLGVLAGQGGQGVVECKQVISGGLDDQGVRSIRTRVRPPPRFSRLRSRDRSTRIRCIASAAAAKK